MAPSTFLPWCHSTATLCLNRIHLFRNAGATDLTWPEPTVNRMAATKKRKAEVQLEAERPINQPRLDYMERGFGKWSAGPGDAYHLDLGDGASILYLRGLFSPSECKRLQQVLLTDLQEGEESTRTRGFKQREVKVWNKWWPEGRLTVYQADNKALAYPYSGKVVEAEPWHPAVLEIKARLELASAATFNSCLLNLYRDGRDKVGWHSDSGAVYDKIQTIGSVSFGASREFVLRRRLVRDENGDLLRFSLGSGDVLVMQGTLQQHWAHTLPPCSGVMGRRLNLTFRNVTKPMKQKA